MYDFKGVQDRIRKFWSERDIFTKSMDANRGGEPREDFVWFDGPPTANGSPGIHHFIGRSYKDLFGRYRTMRGYRVLRKGGWDTHGLPVELQVEKQLGFKSKKDIEAFGIAKFNEKCRESVWTYLKEWEENTRKMAFWLDLDDAYVTYEAPYVESLWNVISEIAKRDLLFQAHRVVQFCTRCGTPLSSHEVALGYEKVTDRSVTVAFKVKTPFKLTGTDQGTVSVPKGTAILAWTTTPWTLPGNVALAVGEGITYVLARKGEDSFIIAKDVAVQVLGAPLAIEAEFPGSALVGLRYEPLFAIPKLKSAKSYRVYPADFVSTSEGTGIVHTAVMYGDEDYQLGTKVGLPKHHTVTEQGTFEGVHADLNGRYVKDSKVEQDILDMLAAKGRLVREDPYEHEYPFCWRCHKPLLYYAKDSWFVRMSALKEEMREANETVNWIPDYIKHGRFGQWIAEGKDWAFSRERYWGTPLPVWMARDSRGRSVGEPLVIGSYEELERYRATEPATLHVMRHGEAENNVKGISDSGQVKSGLTERGHEQTIAAAQAIAKRVKAKRQKVAAIIASPIQRTKETAELVAQELGIKKVIYDERIKEIEIGPRLTGKPYGSYHKLLPTYEAKFSERPEAGETLNDLQDRTWTALRELNERYAGKHVVIVSHEYPIWMIAAAANGWSQEQAISEKTSRDPDDFVTFAQVEELQVKNYPRNEKGRVDPHRPYVDDIVLRHPKTKKLSYRVPDLVDVWFDSGSMPYAQWHWPFENQSLFAKQFPADFITEAHDQTRGWFYTLMAVSVALGKGAPYKNVLSYGHVLDEKGQKMSKSKGNVVKPDTVMDAVGVDAARWYFYTINAPGDVKLFSMKDARERLTGFIMILENCVKFWELYADGADGSEYHHGARPVHLLDRWLMSRLHRLIRETTERMDAFDYVTASRAIEQFTVEDLSQWWLRRSRRRPDALGFLRHILLELDKLIAPFVPYASEDIHQRLYRGSTSDTESVHLHDWPEADPSHIDVGLEEQMSRVREFITDGLAQRSQAGIKVRQPLPAVQVPLAKPLPDDLEQLVLDELNVKEVRYEPAQQVGLDTNITPALKREGWVREIIRTLQGMRKEAGLQMGQEARGTWHAEDDELATAIQEWSDTIARDTSLAAFTQQPQAKGMDIEKEFELAPGTLVSLGIAK